MSQPNIHITAGVHVKIHPPTNVPPGVVVDMTIRHGICRFLGDTSFAPGTWAGVELSTPDGKNDGTVNGVKYFSCPPSHGVFVRPELLEFDCQHYLAIAGEHSKAMEQCEELKAKLEMATLDLEMEKLHVEELQETIHTLEMDKQSAIANVSSLPIPTDVEGLQHQLTETRSQLLIARQTVLELKAEADKVPELQQQLQEITALYDSEQQSSTALDDITLEKLELQDKYDALQEEYKKLKQLHDTEQELVHELEEAAVMEKKAAMQFEESVQHLTHDVLTKNQQLQSLTTLSQNLRNRVDELEKQAAELSQQQQNQQVSERTYKKQLETASVTARKKNQSAIDAAKDAEIRSVREEIAMTQKLIPKHVASAMEAKAVVAISCIRRVTANINILLKTVQQQLSGLRVQAGEEDDGGDGFVAVQASVVKDIRWEALEAQTDALKLMSHLYLLARGASYVEGVLLLESTETLEKVFNTFPDLHTRASLLEEAVRAVFHEVVVNSTFAVRGTNYTLIQNAFEAAQVIVQKVQVLVDPDRGHTFTETSFLCEAVDAMCVAITIHGEGIIRYFDVFNIEHTLVNTLKELKSYVEDVFQYERGLVKDCIPSVKLYMMSNSVTNDLIQIAQTIFVFGDRLQLMHERCWRSCLDVKNGLSNEFMTYEVAALISPDETASLSSSFSRIEAEGLNKCVNSMLRLNRDAPIVVTLDMIHSTEQMFATSAVAFQNAWKEVHTINPEKVLQQRAQTDKESASGMNRRDFPDALSYRLAVVHVEGRISEQEKKELTLLRTEVKELREIVDAKSHVIQTYDKEITEARAAMKGVEIDKAEVLRLRQKVASMQSEFAREKKEVESVYEDAVRNLEQENDTLRHRVADLVKKGGSGGSNSNNANSNNTSVPSTELFMLHSKIESLQNVVRYYQLNSFAATVQSWGSMIPPASNSTTTKSQQQQQSEAEINLQSALNKVTPRLLKVPKLGGGVSGRSEFRDEWHRMENDRKNLEKAYMACVAV